MTKPPGCEWRLIQRHEVAVSVILPLCLSVSVSPIRFPLSGCRSRSRSRSVWFAFLRDHDGQCSALPSSPAHGSTHRTENASYLLLSSPSFLCVAPVRGACCLFQSSLLTLRIRLLNPLTAHSVSPCCGFHQWRFPQDLLSPVQAAPLFLLINTKLCSPSPTSHHDSGQIVPSTCLHLLARLRFRVCSQHLHVAVILNDPRHRSRLLFRSNLSFSNSASDNATRTPQPALTVIQDVVPINSFTTRQH